MRRASVVRKTMRPFSRSAMAWAERGREAKRLRARLSESQAHRCAYCGIRCEDGGTLEHLVPRSKGDATSYENCVMACADCNSGRKTTNPFAYFAARQAALPPEQRAAA